MFTHIWVAYDPWAHICHPVPAESPELRWSSPNSMSRPCPRRRQEPVTTEKIWKEPQLFAVWQPLDHLPCKKHLVQVLSSIHEGIVAESVNRCMLFTGSFHSPTKCNNTKTKSNWSWKTAKTCSSFLSKASGSHGFHQKFLGIRVYPWKSATASCHTTFIAQASNTGVSKRSEMVVTASSAEDTSHSVQLPRASRPWKQSERDWRCWRWPEEQNPCEGWVCELWILQKD